MITFCANILESSNLKKAFHKISERTEYNKFASFPKKNEKRIFGLIKAQENMASVKTLLDLFNNIEKKIKTNNDPLITLMVKAAKDFLENKTITFEITFEVQEAHWLANFIIEKADKLENELEKTTIIKNISSYSEQESINFINYYNEKFPYKERNIETFFKEIVELNAKDEKMKNQILDFLNKPNNNINDINNINNILFEFFMAKNTKTFFTENEADMQFLEQVRSDIYNLIVNSNNKKSEYFIKGDQAFHLAQLVFKIKKYITDQVFQYTWKKKKEEQSDNDIKTQIAMTKMLKEKNNETTQTIITPNLNDKTQSKTNPFDNIFSVFRNEIQVIILDSQKSLEDKVLNFLDLLLASKEIDQNLKGQITNFKDQKILKLLISRKNQISRSTNSIQNTTNTKNIDPYSNFVEFINKIQQTDLKNETQLEELKKIFLKNLEAFIISQQTEESSSFQNNPLFLIPDEILDNKKPDNLLEENPQENQQENKEKSLVIVTKNLVEEKKAEDSISIGFNQSEYDEQESQEIIQNQNEPASPISIKSLINIDEQNSFRLDNQINPPISINSNTRKINANKSINTKKPISYFLILGCFLAANIAILINFILQRNSNKISNIKTANNLTSIKKNLIKRNLQKKNQKNYLRKI